MDQWTTSFALLPQSGTSFCSMTFRFSTSWTTLELDVTNTRTRLLVSGIQFPTDRSDDPLPIKCVCLVSWTKVAPLELSTVVPERDIQERFTL